jgi:hypothetical protein
MQDSEDKIQSDCYLWFHNTQVRLRCLLFHIPNGGKRGEREANKFRAMGVVAGIPDLFLSIPTETHHGLYIEMKTPTGKLSPEQKEVHIKLVSEGYKVIICRSLEDFKKEIKEYLKNSRYSLL